MLPSLSGFGAGRVLARLNKRLAKVIENTNRAKPKDVGHVHRLLPPLGVHLLVEAAFIFLIESWAVTAVQCDLRWGIDDSFCALSLLCAC
jgi:hypothetical protein